MEITKIPYDQLNCKSCHVKSCDQCHLKKNKKFIAYVPYYTHSVAPEGRDCDDCHQNEAVFKIQNG